MAQPYWAPAGLPGQAAPMKQVYANAAHDTIYYCGRTDLDQVDQGFNPVLRYTAGQWDTLGYIYTPIIFSVVLHHDTLFAGGGFTFLDLGTPAEGIAYWANGSWHTYGDLQHAVLKLRVIDDTLYALGYFTMADGQPAKGIARREGGQWVAVGQLPTGEQSWWDVVKYQGRLVTIGNGYINGLRGIFQLVGNEWSALGPGIVGGVSGAACLAVYQGDLYVGGQISIPEGNAGQEIMRWDGTAFHPVATGLQRNLGDLSTFSTCTDLKVHDGLLWACGGFNYAGGVEARGVATWDGTRWCGVPGVLTNNMLGGALSMDFYRDTLFVACGVTADDQFVNFGAKFIGDSYVDSCGTAVGMLEDTSPTSELRVWQSASSELSLVGLPKGVQQVRLFDATGKDLLRQMVRSLGSGTDRIVIPALASGIYFVQIDNYTVKFLYEER
ncbi:MAG: T9SS type A sorting domain-containing protein [Flavobacteriales bacterium]|nr:T9SS type A sorting domain-containing protein [Flavobacteriales bacterium]